jgi:hypothetical protein
LLRVEAAVTKDELELRAQTPTEAHEQFAAMLRNTVQQVRENIQRCAQEQEQKQMAQMTPVQIEQYHAEQVRRKHIIAVQRVQEKQEQAHVQPVAVAQTQAYTQVQTMPAQAARAQAQATSAPSSTPAQA